MELMDVYTPEHMPTGKTIERGERPGVNERILVTHVCIFNSDGKMLIQKRSISKASYPGIWDVSAGGGVKSGEFSFEASIREAKEELGLELLPEDMKFYKAIPFSYVLDDFYYIQLREIDLSALQFQKEEISEVRFASKMEVLEMIESGEFVDYDPKEIQELFKKLS